MKKILVATVALSLVATSAFAVIKGSKHDMSSGGAGVAYKGTNNAQDQICVYCHTPHNSVSSALIWSRNAITVGTLYDKSVSSTLNFTNPTSIGVTSQLCLSCHDGTLAVDSYKGFAGTTAITNSAKLGTDLTNDHPIGFSYATATVDTDIKNTAALPLYKNGTLTDSMECATCHDVHAKVQSTYFLRINNAGSNLCLNCHGK